MERGRTGEREGEKHQWVVASQGPPTGNLACSRNLGMCPDWESNPLVLSPALNPRSYTSQGLFIFSPKGILTFIQLLTWVYKFIPIEYMQQLQSTSMSLKQEKYVIDDKICDKMSLLIIRFSLGVIKNLLISFRMGKSTFSRLLSS